MNILLIIFDQSAICACTRVGMIQKMIWYLTVNKSDVNLPHQFNRNWKSCHHNLEHGQQFPNVPNESMTIRDKTIQILFHMTTDAVTPAMTRTVSVPFVGAFHLVCCL